MGNVDIESIPVKKEKWKQSDREEVISEENPQEEFPTDLFKKDIRAPD